MLSFWTGIPLLASLVWNPEETLAQSTEVTTCLPEYDWASNSKQQNPCLVAAYLETTCGKSYSVPAIPAGTHYIPPTVAQADPCLCSSVYYSLISACGGCQGRTYVNWTAWSTNCSQILVTKFPNNIPSTTEVPTWAYLNVTESNNIFDPLRAKLVSEQVPASSTTTSAAPVTSQAPPTSSPVSVPTSGSSPTPASSSSSSSGTSTPAGAIAGGVVGGIVLLAAVALAVFWYRKQRGENDKDQTGSRVGSWVRKQNRRRKRSQGGKIDLDEDVASVTPFPPGLSQKPDPRFAAASPTSGLTAGSGTVMQTVQDLRTVTSPSPPAQGMSSITSSPYGHTREISDPISPITSAFFTTGHQNSVETLPYTGSQVTRGAYNGAAEI